MSVRKAFLDDTNSTKKEHAMTRTKMSAKNVHPFSLCYLLSFVHLPDRFMSRVNNVLYYSRFWQEPLNAVVSQLKKAKVLYL